MPVPLVRWVTVRRSRAAILAGHRACRHNGSHQRVESHLLGGNRGTSEHGKREAD
jgi:hypothetical protein